MSNQIGLKIVLCVLTENVSYFLILYYKLPYFFHCTLLSCFCQNRELLDTTYTFSDFGRYKCSDVKTN